MTARSRTTDAAAITGRYPHALEELIGRLMRLPGVGMRAAERMALHLLEAGEGERRELAEAIRRLESDVRFCSVCGALAAGELCRICSNPRRDRQIVCVVEWPHEVTRLDEVAGFNGAYHVLMGHLDPDAGIGPDNLRCRQLVERVRQHAVSEVILALNPTVAGDATADYLAGLLRADGVKVTRLARGVPFGSELEYMRPESLRHALQKREELP